MNRTARWGFALALLPIAACSSNPPPVASTPSAPPPPALSADDQTFIQMAGASDAFEIQSSQLAQQKARRPAVKTFAGQMIQDHTQTTTQLTQIAGSKGVTPPAPQLSADQQAMLTKLQGEMGARFDRDYAHDQVMAHQMAISAYQAEIAGGQDADLKSFAQQTLPTLQQHLTAAQSLAGIRQPRPMRARHGHAAASGSSSGSGGDSSGTDGSTTPNAQ